MSLSTGIGTMSSSVFVDYEGIGKDDLGGCFFFDWLFSKANPYKSNQ